MSKRSRCDHCIGFKITRKCKLCEYWIPICTHRKKTKTSEIVKIIGGEDSGSWLVEWNDKQRTFISFSVLKDLDIFERYLNTNIRNGKLAIPEDPVSYIS